MSTRDKPCAVNDHSDCDEFDRLLEQSSVGTRAARENQARTPAEAYQRLEEHLRSGRPDRCGDVDDFLLHMVRWYSAERDAEGTVLGWMHLAVHAQVGTCKHSLRWSSVHPDRPPDVTPTWDIPWPLAVILVIDLKLDAVPKIVQTLHDREMFSYLRSDVARGMVDICFTSRRPLPVEIMAACASAVPASQVREDLTLFLSEILRPPALPAGNWCRVPALPAPEPVDCLEPDDESILVRTVRKRQRRRSDGRRFGPLRLPAAGGRHSTLIRRQRTGAISWVSSVQRLVVVAVIILLPEVAIAIVLALSRW